MITYRAAVPDDAPALARVMIDANVHAFIGRVPEQCLKWITPEESATNWRRTIETRLRPEECLLVAEDEESVVGYALAKLIDTEPGYRSELRSMAVAPSHQRRGIGRELVTRVAAHLAKNSASSMLVRVLMVNPNRGFYERLGASLLRTEPHEWNGVPLTMAVYRFL